MISPSDIRQAVRKVLEPIGITIYGCAPTGSLRLPCIILGMPEWSRWNELSARAQEKMDAWEVPVIVVVAMSAADPVTSVDSLDKTWPTVVSGLQDAIRSDQTLGGVCCSAIVDGAKFGSVSIANKEYPSYHIGLTLYDN